MFPKKLILFFCCNLIFSPWAKSQPDSNKILTAENFLQQLKSFHPVMQQANIIVNKAQSDLQQARGSFDPLINANASRKTFDGKNYYFYNNPELKIPTVLPVNIKTGIEYNGGELINSEITKGGSGYIGVEVPLIKDFLIDSRRAALQQAKIFLNQSEQDRLVMINDLIFSAYVHYWEWAAAYQLFSIYSEYVTVSDNRLRLVRIAFENGDRSMADTVEAYTQVQNFLLMQSSALIRLQQAKYNLSNYLWLDSGIPYELPDYFIPDIQQFNLTSLPQSQEILINQLKTQHPQIRSYRLKLDGLEVERRLKFQSMLPALNVSANLLNKNYYALKGLDAALLQNNYKWGVEFKLPLLLREGRGSYQKTKWKIRETDLELDRKSWEMENKIKTYYAENTQLLKQIAVTDKMYQNYSSLLRNEELRFRQGESSLFLVNTRENKVLETIQKQTDLRLKYLKSKIAMEWAAGLLR